VHLQTRSITASKCIFEFTQSLGLQVHLQTRSIMASKYIFKDRRQLFGDTRETEVDRVTGSIYSADPGVDRHYLISISSIPFGCRERWGGVLMLGSLPSSSFVSPQWPPSGASPSARNISIWAELLHQSGRAPSEPSETHQWGITPRRASIPPIALHIALQSPFRSFFSLCRSPI